MESSQQETYLCIRFYVECQVLFDRSFLSSSRLHDSHSSQRLVFLANITALAAITMLCTQVDS